MPISVGDTRTEEIDEFAGRMESRGCAEFAPGLLLEEAAQPANKKQRRQKNLMPCVYALKYLPSIQ